MEKILLDTDVLITIEDNRQAFEQVKGKFLMASIISAYEFLFGEAYLGRDVKAVKKSFETLVDIVMRTSVSSCPQLASEECIGTHEV